MIRGSLQQRNDGREQTNNSSAQKVNVNHSAKLNTTHRQQGIVSNVIVSAPHVAREKCVPVSVYALDRELQLLFQHVKRAKKLQTIPLQTAPTLKQPKSRDRGVYAGKSQAPELSSRTQSERHTYHKRLFRLQTNLDGV